MTYNTFIGDGTAIDEDLLLNMRPFGRIETERGDEIQRSGEGYWYVWTANGAVTAGLFEEPEQVCRILRGEPITGADHG